MAPGGDAAGRAKASPTHLLRLRILPGHPLQHLRQRLVDAEPGQRVTHLDAPLLIVLAGDRADGRARLRVEVEDAPLGVHDLNAGGVDLPLAAVAVDHDHPIVSVEAVREPLVRTEASIPGHRDQRSGERVGDGMCRRVERRGGGGWLGGERHGHQREQQHVVSDASGRPILHRIQRDLLPLDTHAARRRVHAGRAGASLPGVAGLPRQRDSPERLDPVPVHRAHGDTLASRGLDGLAIAHVDDHVTDAVLGLVHDQVTGS